MGEFITISDEELRKGIRIAIGQPVSFVEEPIHKNRLKRLEYLNVNSFGIRSLEGIEQCQSLKHLCLADNQCSDLSPLQKLTKLERLDLSYHASLQWESLTQPMLSIKEIVLQSCGLKDDSILRYFPNVKGVILFNNQITEFHEMWNLKNLEYVDLRYNPISVQDIEIFVNLTGVDVESK